MGDLETYREKLKKSGPNGYIDRQNTKWAKEISGKCEHDWKPVSMVIENGLADGVSAKTFLICLKCHSHTYVETGYVGYCLGSPDTLEELNNVRAD